MFSVLRGGGITKNEVERGVLADENSSQLHGDGVIESGTAYVPKLSEIDNMEVSFTFRTWGSSCFSIVEGPEQATLQDYLNCESLRIKQLRLKLQ